MKEQDAAHSLDGYNKNDANLCPVMNGYYCFDRACGIDHKKQCMMINPKDKIYVDGSKAGDYIQQHIAYRREMEMNYAKMQDELTRLRSELQQLKAWKESELKLWGPILEYMRTHPDRRLGESIPDRVLEFLKEHSRLKSELQQERELKKQYTAQELDVYKTKLKKKLNNFSKDKHGRIFTTEIIELIDKL